MFLTWSDPPKGLADLSAAKTEAERLSKQSPGKRIAVLQVVGYCVTPAPKPEWHEMDVQAEPVPTDGAEAFRTAINSERCPFAAGTEERKRWNQEWAAEQDKTIHQPEPHMYERKKGAAGAHLEDQGDRHE